MNWIKNNWRVLLAVLALIIILCILGWFLWQHQAANESKLQQAIVLSEKQAADNNVLQNELKISKQNAEMLAAAVKQAQAGQLQPVTHFYVQAPTVQQAAQDIAERINKNDTTLPPMALEKTDRTVTVPQEVTQKDGSKEWQVGIYKVNNYRNWEWSVGYGQHGGDRYVPVEVQRNFSKDAAASYEHHFFGKQAGWEAKYTRKTDKLLWLF